MNPPTFVHPFGVGAVSNMGNGNRSMLCHMRVHRFGKLPLPRRRWLLLHMQWHFKQRRLHHADVCRTR